MAAPIRRKITFTVCEVVDASGEAVDVMRVIGKLSAPRMANIARRDKQDSLLSVRNLEHVTKLYEMSAEEFMQYATEVEEKEI